ncbi:MAG: dATP/dGTP pyrophosphohydrolase domain-containing protein [Magnetovibrionaceae bacterium]
MDLIAHLKRQRAFSKATFGPGARTQGVIDHIRKELDEIEANPEDITEWVDVILLALDGAWRAGYSPESIVEAMEFKQSINEERDWPDWRTADPTKAIEHVR